MDATDCTDREPHLMISLLMEHSGFVATEGGGHQVLEVV